MVRNTGSSYIVRTDGGEQVECRVKGNFRLKGIRTTNPVAVGDGVVLRITPNDEIAFITAIDERRNYIIRKASNLSKQSHILAANIDRALLVATIARPETSTTFIDRFLASAEAYRVPVVLAFNKIDDLNEEERAMLDYLTWVYRDIGYEVLHLSAATGEGLPELAPYLRDRITLLAGHSGVGKSTLLNRLIPGACVRTAEISESHGTGMHTTTFSQLLDLPDGASSTFPASKVSAPSTWNPKKSPTISATSSPSATNVASPTAPTPTNPDVLYAKRLKRTALRPRVTPLISPCSKITTKTSTARLFSRPRPLAVSPVFQATPVQPRTTLCSTKKHLRNSI